jgi:hypothetical protein
MEQDEITGFRDEAEIDDTGCNLFTCPEPHCMLSFSKYGNLIRHLDVGSHKIKATISSLLDKSKVQYVDKIEKKLVNLPNSSLENTGNEKSCELLQGWGLKLRRPVKKFSVTQVAFLKEKFAKGERTGHKCDPEEVSSEMRITRNGLGKRIFVKDEFLSANQISSYFSRLALEKRRSACHNYELEDIEAERNIEAFEELEVLARK